MIGLAFKMTKMQGRFLDRKVADSLNPITRRFFMRAGGAIRLTARRSLKMARRKRLAELTRWELERHRERQKYLNRSLRLLRRGKAGAFDDGLVDKSRLPQMISQPGQPPLLHSKGSLLKARLFFALSPDKKSVVVGPEAIGRNARIAKGGGLTSLRELEARRPFMVPAFDTIEPRFPEYLSAAVR